MSDEYESEEETVYSNLIGLLQTDITSNQAEIREALKLYHPADLAEYLSEFPHETRSLLLELLDPEQTGEVLALLEEPEDFIEDAQVAELAEILDTMQPDDAADVLEHVDDKKAEAVINALDPDHADDIRELSEYDSDQAGGIMTTDFFWVSQGENAAQILARLKVDIDEVETIQELFVCREDQKLTGIIEIEDLISADADTLASSLMDPATIAIGHKADQEICARYMRKYNLDVLPVINSRRQLLGIITADDIIDVMADEAQEDLFHMAGVGSSHPFDEGAWARAWKRLPWLSATIIGTGLITPVIIHRYFSETLGAVMALAFFMPAIMGIGGNVAVQSSTITVRGLATGQIEFKDIWWLLRRELAVACIIAVVCAVVFGGFAYLMLSTGMTSVSPLKFSVTISVSMVVSIITSILLGTISPMICHRCGVDPALASGPFVTAMIDISTQVMYLGLATFMLLG